MIGGIILFISIIILLFVIYLASKKRYKNREGFIKNMNNILKGPLKDTKATSINGPKSIKFNFFYKDREFLFIDMATRFYGGYYGGDDVRFVHLTTRINNSFGLRLLSKSGETILGRTFDKMRAKTYSMPKTYQKIESSSLPAELKNWLIYTNDLSYAIRFLADNEVRKIYNQYFQPKYSPPGRFPIIIQENQLTLTFEGYCGVLRDLERNPESINSYLTQMCVLADKLNKDN